MKKMQKRWSVGVFIAVVTMLNAAHAEKNWGYTDSDAAQFPYAFYDINVTTPETMRNFLGVIDSTYDLLISKGVKAKNIHFVVSLRGMSVAFATETFSKPDGDNPDLGVQIRGYLDSLTSKGVRIEACAISLDWVSVSAESLVDQIVVIDNAFAAAVWYQRRGFALVPITELP